MKKKIKSLRENVIEQNTPTTIVVTMKKMMKPVRKVVRMKNKKSSDLQKSVERRTSVAMRQCQRQGAKSFHSKSHPRKNRQINAEGANLFSKRRTRVMSKELKFTWTIHIKLTG